MLVLSHFKGHPAGGYGGALKQLSIGCASSEGKSLIHSGGYTNDQNIVWEHMAEQDVSVNPWQTQPEVFWNISEAIRHLSI